MAIVHYQNCSADYPEKPKGEAAQETIVIVNDDGTEVHQCADCGASEIVSR